MPSNSLKDVCKRASDLERNQEIWVFPSNLVRGSRENLILVPPEDLIPLVVMQAKLI
jgi:hypothetical protein